MLNNHIRFSTHYVQHGLCVDDDDDDDDAEDRSIQPLGCMSVSISRLSCVDCKIGHWVALSLYSQYFIS